VAKIPNANLTDGKLVYDQKCEACHYSTSSEKKIGPGLAGLMKRSKFKNGMAANNDHLRRVIERGGKDMPGFRDSLTGRQVRDLIAYVNTF
jgi:mono/diheme cytochrome c family protein